MTKNLRLKIELWDRGISQETLSTETNIPRAYISLGINGRYNFDRQQKRKIATALNCDEKQLFPEE